MDKEFIICFSSWKFYAALVFLMAIEIYYIHNREKLFIEYIIIISCLYILNVVLLDLNIKMDKVQGKIPHILGFNFKVFDIILGKIFFISLLSTLFTTIFLLTYRLLYSESLFRNGHFLMEAFLIEFFIVGLSTLVYYKLEDPRALIFLPILTVIGLSQTKSFMIRFAQSDYFHITIILIFIIANGLLLKFIQARKNEFFF